MRILRLNYSKALHWIVHLLSVITIAYILYSVDFPRDHISYLENSLDFTEPLYAEDDSVAKRLYSEQRVLCWVMTGPANHQTKAKSVKETWGKRCNVLLFMSSESDDSLRTVKLLAVEGRESFWRKTKEAFSYVWERYRDQADWFVKADDDTYMVVENLRYVLSAYNTSDPVYFGHKMKGTFMAGGASYVLSKEALKRFVEIGLKSPKICTPIDSGSEDGEMGRFMRNLNVTAADSRDSYGRNRFLQFNVSFHLNSEDMDKKSWLWYYLYYPVKPGIDCCSDTLIAFHYVSPKEMRTYDYLVYHLHPYGIAHNRASLQKYPASAPDKNLTATPYPGPSDEDREIAKKYREQQKEMEAMIAKYNEKAKLLDANKTLRQEEVERRKQDFVAGH